MGLFTKLFSRKPAPSTKTVSHTVAGTSYRQEVIQAMGVKNPDYALNKRQLVKKYPQGKTVSEYLFLPRKAELIPEPENPHDPKAIKVIIDGQHVGYIKAGSCAHIHRLLQENRIQKIKPKIVGGNYKELHPWAENAQKSEDYELEKESAYFGVLLDITEISAE